MKLITASILILTEILTISILAQGQASFEQLLASDRSLSSTSRRTPSDPPRPSTPPGTPPDRSPSGTRGPCDRRDSFLTPLLPAPDPTTKKFSGLTLKEQPIFWFYIPYQNPEISLGRFSLEDSQGNRFYQIDFKLPSTPGFSSIKLPQNKSLEENQQYLWTFRVYCKPSFESDSILYRGTIQRVSSQALTPQLSTATLGRITFYAEHQLWYDASENLDEIRRHPEEWANLLKIMGLENLNQAPILGEVSPIER